MNYSFIISNRKPWLKKLSEILITETLYSPVCITLSSKQKSATDTASANYQTPVALFQSIVQKFMTVPAEALRKSVVVVDDVISPRFLDPLSTRLGCQQFYAMLMLAFPELQFVFLNTIGLPSQRMCLLSWLDMAKNRKQQKYYQACQLFDPHGIRYTIKLNIRENHTKISPIFPKRNHLAVSVEDEVSYALYHGYAAYKTFHKCKVINSLAHLNHLAKEIEDNKDWSEGYPEWLSNHTFDPKVLFDDLFLNFHDRTGNEALSNIQERYNKYPTLQKTDRKFLITVGHFLEKEQHQVPNDVVEIEKPGKGIYHLLSQTKLLDDYKSKRNKIFDGNIPNSGENKSQSQNNHSTPGRLLIIAESLIKRAEHLLTQCRTVSDAIHTATLASEAKELLGSLTPTESLRALAVQHKAEITAESLFYGVEYEMDLTARFEDIKAETMAISKRFKKENSHKQHLNAYLNLVEHLAKDFSQWNQFDEELACLNEARRVRHELKTTGIKSRFIKSFSILVYWYADNSISSLRFQLLAMLSWISGFALLFCLITLPCIGNYLGILECWCIDIGHSLNPFDALLVSLASFFTIDTSPDWVSNRLNGHALYVLLFVAQSIIAFLHLSLLITYGFLKLSRR